MRSNSECLQPTVKHGGGCRGLVLHSPNGVGELVKIDIIMQKSTITFWSNMQNHLGSIWESRTECSNTKRSFESWRVRTEMTKSCLRLFRLSWGTTTVTQTLFLELKCYISMHICKFQPIAAHISHFPQTENPTYSFTHLLVYNSCRFSLNSSDRSTSSEVKLVNPQSSQWQRFPVVLWCEVTVIY